MNPIQPALSPVVAQTQEHERRLTELEIKASFAEDLLDELNRVVIRQQGQIDFLTRQVLELRAQAPERDADGMTRLQDDLPPHY
ncbi:MAG: SlyX family protein [Pseudomonadota bacterium]